MVELRHISGIAEIRLLPATFISNHAEKNNLLPGIFKLTASLKQAGVKRVTKKTPRKSGEKTQKSGHKKTVANLLSFK